MGGRPIIWRVEESNDLAHERFGIEGRGAGDASLAPPFVRGAHAAGRLAMGFWDHRVTGANATMTKLCHE